MVRTKGRDAARTQESVAERRKRAKKILAGLRTTYGEVTCALQHRSALELLVATILSAQSTDETVNRVTPSLFRKYPTAKALAEADRTELENEIHATGFFRQKAKSIQGACRLILERFGGEVPNRMEDLVELPGVARKTANVVLGTWFKQNDGIVVDTHVGRLAERMALTWTSKTAKDAGKIETDLMELIPQADWTYFSHVLIRHGRQVCAARKPQCQACAVAKACPSAGVLGNGPETAADGSGQISWQNVKLTGATGSLPARATHWRASRQWHPRPPCHISLPDPPPTEPRGERRFRT